jgi:hypothetical protein
MIFFSILHNGRVIQQRKHTVGIEYVIGRNPPLKLSAIRTACTTSSFLNASEEPFSPLGPFRDILCYFLILPDLMIRKDKCSF